MKPCTATHLPRVQGDAAAPADKYHDGGGGVGGLLRPSRICYLTMLSTTFWAMIFYFHSMQGNMASVLLNSSAFSLPSLSSIWLGQDRCAGRYVYMYDLPPRFNADLARDCAKLSVTTDMCKHVVNGGFGPTLPPGGALPERGACDTDQFMLAMIFHSRMMRYECLTSDPAAADVVYVPFYGGFDASMNVWKSDLSARDGLSRDLVDWLVRRPEWRAMGGRVGNL